MSPDSVLCPRIRRRRPLARNSPSRRCKSRCCRRQPCRSRRSRSTRPRHNSTSSHAWRSSRRTRFRCWFSCQRTRGRTTATRCGDATESSGIECLIYFTPHNRQYQWSLCCPLELSDVPVSGLIHLSDADGLTSWYPLALGLSSFPSVGTAGFAGALVKI